MLSVCASTALFLMSRSWMLTLLPSLFLFFLISTKAQAQAHPRKKCYQKRDDPNIVVAINYDIVGIEPPSFLIVKANGKSYPVEYAVGDCDKSLALNYGRGRTGVVDVNIRVYLHDMGPHFVEYPVSLNSPLNRHGVSLGYGDVGIDLLVDFTSDGGPHSEVLKRTSRTIGAYEQSFMTGWDDLECACFMVFLL
ncbi:hypothetical protein RF11_07406 [Thelohanellus kitauei]|uniref:Uncharacterized protein n=1 Tax=Thelohanellus kitauei TaxID=669202 RepID=A0A0C2NDY9_THEKT|nr:hypothetical protein RF11_07406 [Thelohanellus kitauei]